MNLYQILGVDKNATKAQIKSAYKAASKINHPDAGGDQEKFKEIANAYEILYDDERRQRYDSTGYTGKAIDFKQLFADFLNTVIIPEIEHSSNIEKDMVKFIIGKIQILKDKGSEILSSHKKAKKNDEALVNRLKYNGNSEDIFIQVAKSRIDSWQKKIEVVEGEIDLLNRIKKEIEQYTYKFDSAKSGNNFPFEMGGFISDKITFR